METQKFAEKCWYCGEFPSSQATQATFTLTCAQSRPGRRAGTIRMGKPIVHSQVIPRCERCKTCQQHASSWGTRAGLLWIVLWVGSFLVRQSVLAPAVIVAFWQAMFDLFHLPFDDPDMPFWGTCLFLAVIVMLIAITVLINRRTQRLYLWVFCRDVKPVDSGKQYPAVQHLINAHNDPLRGGMQHIE